MAHVLVVDDEASVAFALGEILADLDHTSEAVNDAAAALACLDRGAFDLVLTDFAMPGMDGLELLSTVRARDPELPIVLLTARGSERLAVRAIRAGAFDYLPKPFELDELETIVARALEVGRLRRDARRAAAETSLGRPLIGRAPAFTKLVESAVRIARRDVPVVVRGETGTGKELVASLLHAASPRAAGPFVRFNCAAIAEELAESELFGHVRGAFTGASRDHQGYFAQADGGTLVLDEIGELSPRLQPKLLRALQSGEIQPVGARSIARADVRVVACTHRDLAAEVRAGRFREDLYFRLAVVVLEMPPLRERASDVPLLAELFARDAARRFGLEGVSLAPGLVRALAERDYPGNVRELENLVTRLVALSEGGPIDERALDPREGVTASTGSFRERVEALEQSLLTRALEESAGNQSQAARRLGLSRATFLDKLKRYGL
jgi:DNA-binding NtrC family response regulator